MAMLNNQRVKPIKIPPENPTWGPPHSLKSSLEAAGGGAISLEIQREVGPNMGLLQWESSKWYMGVCGIYMV